MGRVRVVSITHGSSFKLYDLATKMQKKKGNSEKYNHDG